MYLKELTLRGFKSFASATTLRFEPGITAVVGPNGSGKSNIVDALAWVMGEQGARNLRGTSMEDVIFAGTSSRPALGRAQVSLTIDNTDHALDIDYEEVTISRTIFRNGGSEYAINGAPCRLLDVQELLSDTGLGQQMHVIVGQGRLDQILRADPAGHRAFIEEAAGIIKHRRRKERALRKLANTETNLNRLDDLLGEIHRRMGPLGRQARVSRRADAIKVSLRDAQARLYAEDAAKAMRAADDVHTGLTKVRGDLEAARRDLARIKVRIEQVEAEVGRSTPAIDGADRSWRDLTRLRERFEALASVGDERAHALTASLVADAGPDPDLLEARVKEVDALLDRQRAIVDDARLALENATESRADGERRLAAVRGTLAELRRSAKERDGRIALLRERIARAESAVELARSRAKDLTAQRDELERARSEARETLARLEGETASPSDGGDGLEDARSLLAERRRASDEAVAAQRELGSRIVSLEAKADALRDALDHGGSCDVLRDDGDVAVMGRLADFIRAADGWEEAVSQALGRYAGAVVVPGPGNMVRALERARGQRLGGVALIGMADRRADRATRDDSNAGDVSSADAPGPAGAAGIRPVPLAALVDVNPEAPDADVAGRVAAAVRALLGDVVAVATLDDARSVMDSSSACRVVTRSGEILEAGVAATAGSPTPRSDLSLAARRDKALDEARELHRRLHEADARVEETKAACDEASRMVEQATRRRTESRLKAEQAARGERDARRRLTEIDGRMETLERRIAAVADEEASRTAELDDLRTALEAAGQAGKGGTEPDEFVARERDLESSLGIARNQEVAATIAWNEATRKADSYGRQTAALRADARGARERRERIGRENASRRERAARAAALVDDARSVAAMIDGAIEAVAARRDVLRTAASDHDTELRSLRGRRDGLEPKVADLSAREHVLDVERERIAAESDQLARRVGEELGMTVRELIDGYGPDRPVPVLGEDGAPVPLDAGSRADAGEGDGDARPRPQACRTVPYVRAEQLERLQKAKRDLARLGKVNPLATEEFEALEARNRYLNDQRNDVARSRDDLMRLVRDLDATMLDVFRSAFDDTAEAFGRVFATLFPGGTGRLRLERPDDPLSSGVIVEASPAGKRVRQLGLLSGGERSLTALALLFAIFTARPSPFYVMDEVEAALDDVNLTRLLDALDGLREHAQLIVITHQQRTMSIADALYGVTMRDDGVTAVVSQRLAGAGAV